MEAETCKMGIYHQLDAGEICLYLVQYIRLQCIVAASFQLLIESYFVQNNFYTCRYYDFIFISL